MKQTVLILFIILTFNISFACSCGKFKTFISASKQSELVIKAKVLGHNYYNRQQQAISKEQIKDSKYFGHSITVEVIEIIKGTENRRQFEIYGGIEWEYFYEFQEKVNKLETNKIYIFSLLQASYYHYTQPNENNEDYTFYTCQESYVEYIEELDSVKGVLKSLNLDKVRIILYDKLKKKIL